MTNIMGNSIFSYEGTRGDLVEAFYRLLLTGRIVSYEDVLSEYEGKPLSFTVSCHDLYGMLKKVVPEVVRAFNENGFTVIRIPRGRSTDYQYLGTEKDPLEKIKFRTVLKKRFGNLEEAIATKSPRHFEYKPFDRAKKDLIFHPHIMKEYNGRLFSIGVSEMEGKEPFRRYVVALDRIQGEIRGASSSCVYIPPLADEYRYLSNLVGVTLEENAELTTITLRAHDKYTFGRLKTKPMHSTQRIVCWPSFEEGRETGDFELTVYPNNELVGQILSYGSMLEVVGPDDFRQRVAEELEKMSRRYGMVLCGGNQ